jgi:hypothetical protein
MGFSSVKPGQTWSNLVKPGQTWSNLVKPSAVGTQAAKGTKERCRSGRALGCEFRAAKMPDATPSAALAFLLSEFLANGRQIDFHCRRAKDLFRFKT